MNANNFFLGLAILAASLFVIATILNITSH